jgi:hypothetical protein
VPRSRNSSGDVVDRRGDEFARPRVVTSEQRRGGSGPLRSRRNLIPGADWSVATGISTPQTMSIQTPVWEQQASVAAENDFVRPIYGSPRVGAQVLNILPYYSSWVFVLLWGYGPVQSITELVYNDGYVGYLPVTPTHYDGSQTTVDSYLQSVYLANSIGYNDTLEGYAYSIVTLPATITNGYSFSARISGIKCWDPRLNGGAGAYAHTENPSLHTADWITNTVYGMGESILWSSVITAANRNDASVGSPAEPRNRCHIVIDSGRPGREWLEVLRTYAECFVDVQDGVYVLIPDMPLADDNSPDYVFSHATGNIIDIPQFNERGMKDLPTVVDVRYTIDTTFPSREGRATAYTSADVPNGTAPWRESSVMMPGINRYSEAYRQAVQRLNKLTICDLTCTLLAFDEALKLYVGNVVKVTHPTGFTDKLMRVLGIENVSPGTWNLQLSEYYSNVYSDVVLNSDDYPDAIFPDPSAPPTPTGLLVIEEIYQTQTGNWASRLRVTWTDQVPIYIYTYGYEIVVLEGATVIETGRPTKWDTEYVTSALPENHTYTVSLYLVSIMGVHSVVPAQYAITNNGKLARPSDVVRIDGYEVGGDVRLSWVPATDLDLTATELRYSTTGGSWSTATLLDRIAAPAVRYSTRQLPPGTWRIWAKGLDSIRTLEFPHGQESVTAVFIDISVTSDANAYLSGEFNHAWETSSHMSIQKNDHIPFLVSDDNVSTWNSIFTNALNSYTNPLFTYPGGFTTGAESNHHDFGLNLTGTWAAIVNHQNISGTAVPYLDLSLTDSGYTSYTALSASVEARWSKLRIESTGTLVLPVQVGDTVVRAVTVGRREAGSITTNASAPVTVTLSGHYVRAVAINITPMVGATGGYGTPDNIVVGIGTNSFDAYSFNTNGDRTAVACTWTFDGV